MGADGLTVAVVGLGYWGPRIVRNLSSIPLCHKVVACDHSRERIDALSEQYTKVECEQDSFKAVSREDVDAVVIATPTHSHYELAKLALSLGKGVMVEKPMVPRLDQALELFEVAKGSGALLTTGYTYLFSEPVRYIHSLLSDGGLGGLQYIRSTRANLGRHQSDVNVLWDLGPHDLSILFRWIGRLPTTVAAFAKTSLDGRPEDVASLNLQFNNGVLADIHLSWLAPRKVREIVVVGDKRMLVYDDTNTAAPITVFNTHATTSDSFEHVQYFVGETSTPFIEGNEPLHSELEDFLRRLESGDIRQDDEYLSVAIVKTLAAAEESLRTGLVIRMEGSVL